MSDADPDRTDEATEAADLEDAAVQHQPDRMPTPDEEEAAERGSAGVSDSALESAKEATERGAAVEGEGQI